MKGLFKRKLVWLLIATFVVLIITAVSSGFGKRFMQVGQGNPVSIVVSPVQGAFSAAGGKVSDFFSFFTQMGTLKDENDLLKVKVAQLEVENGKVQSLTDENNRLREALGLKQQFSEYRQIAANVIAKDPGNWFFIFTVDKGTKDGVYPNATVVTPSGLVGQVIDAGYNSSKVLSIIDEDSTLSSCLTKTRDITLLKGDINLREQAMCRLDYISPDVDLMIGDMVETSGMGGIFPKGIQIGKVKEIRTNGHDLNRYAVIQPLVDFKRLEEVYIMLDTNRQK